MTAEEIVRLGPELEAFLTRFDCCFASDASRENLSTYVQGQLSELPRKSVEPMAWAAGIDERALQLFLSQRGWDHEQLRDTMQRMVAAEHADGRGIGIVDETSHPKKGDKTPGVQRQYCGATGKIDNCVVTVHVVYAQWDGSFHTLLDSDLYLPKDWAADAPRCAAAGIPPELGYRPKWVIALEQLDRALANGVTLRWIAADEGYGSKPGFLTGVIDRGLQPAVEVPRTFRGWSHPPLALTPTATRTSTVEKLARHSPNLASQPWTPHTVKNTSKGPVVWETRTMAFAFRDGSRIVRDATLIVARNPLQEGELKYFVVVAQPATPESEMVHAAFARPAVEDAFLRAKEEFGLSHYEGRTYTGLMRHCYITALTLFFAMCQTLTLRKKTSRGHAVPSAPGHQRAAATAA